MWRKANNRCQQITRFQCSCFSLPRPLRGIYWWECLHRDVAIRKCNTRYSVPFRVLTQGGFLIHALPVGPIGTFGDVHNASAAQLLALAVRPPRHALVHVDAVVHKQLSHVHARWCGQLHSALILRALILNDGDGDGLRILGHAAIARAGLLQLILGAAEEDKVDGLHSPVQLREGRHHEVERGADHPDHGHRLILPRRHRNDLAQLISLVHEAGQRRRPGRFHAAHVDEGEAQIRAPVNAWESVQPHAVEAVIQRQIHGLAVHILILVGCHEAW
mmetsp:Transcript_2511/g.6986  ORF Transcript_2511/g.6986 Transcript_2511/m.6986 type:complete len:275 (-) Transcript_2511:1669-2493(-)